MRSRLRVALVLLGALSTGCAAPELLPLGPPPAGPPAPALSVLSGMGFVAISVYDLIDAFFVPRRMYRKRLQQRSAGVAALPMPLDAGDGRLVPGIVWVGRF